MIPAEKQLFMQRVHSLKKKWIDKSGVAPSAAVTSVLSLWQQKQFPLICEEIDRKTSSFTQDKAVNELAIWLTKRPFLESAFWLSSAYAIWVGEDVQYENSLYFTPPVLAERLIDNLISHGASLVDDIWMDPACGGGAFLAPVAVRMIQSMTQHGFEPSEIIRRVTNNLIGNDIDKTLAYLATQFILMSLYEQLKSSKVKPRFKISIGDGLLTSRANKEKASVVICNPPYRKMKSTEVKRYAETFGEVIEGQPNIYGLFIRQCLRLGKKNAVMGLLTPTSYLSGRYFSKLRKTILSEAAVCQLDLIDDRVGVFIGVSQGAVLSLYKRTAEKTNAIPQTDVYTLSITGEFTKIGKSALSNCTGAWPIPREHGDQEIIQQASSSPYRLKDFGYVARVGTYVDYRDTRKTYTKQPNNKKMKAVFPIIWSSDITTDGAVVHGRTSEDDGHHTFIEMGHSDHSAIIRRPVIALQRVTSPDQPRRLVCAPIDEKFVRTHGGIVGENHVIFLEKTSDNSGVSTEELACILGTEPIDRLFRSISGAVNVSVFELNQLPLPDPRFISDCIQDGVPINDAVIESFKRSKRDAKMQSLSR